MNYLKRYPKKLELVREDSKKVGDLLLLEEFNSPKLKDWYFCHPGGLISSWCTNLGKTLNIKHAEHCFSVSGIQNMKHKLIKDLRASYRGASFPKKSPAIRSSIVMCPSQAQCGQTIRCFSSLLQWLDNSFKNCREDSIHLVVSSLFLSILDQLKFTFNNMKTKPVQQKMHYNQLAVKLMLKISLKACLE